VDPKELGWGGVDWIYVALCGPMVGSFNMLMTLESSIKSVDCLEKSEPTSVSQERIIRGVASWRFIEYHLFLLL